jgi:hypothetical protein
MKELILYRIIGSDRVKWRFVLDDNHTILQEGPAPTAVTTEQILRSDAAVSTTPPGNSGERKPLSEKVANELRQRGIVFHEDNGHLVVDHIPHRELLIRDFLMNKCCADIPNCQMLMDQMNQEITNAGGEKCPGCTKNKIRMKYRQLLTTLLQDLQDPK